jgi:YbbR domain-containing protein
LSTRLNIPLMIVSLLISITLWLVVLARDIPVPVGLHLHVKYENLDNEQFWVNPDPGVNQSTVYLKFVGPSEKIQDLKDNNPAVEIDLSQAKAGTFQYRATLNPPTDQQFLFDKDIWPRVAIERKASRTVPVEVAAVGKLQDPTLAVDTGRFAPRTATVTGPVSIVNQVSKCVARLQLERVTLSDIQPIQAGLVAYDYQSRPYNPPYNALHIDPGTVVVTPAITSAPSQRTALVSPRIFGQPAPGYLPLPYTVEPTTVTLSGDPSILINTTVVDTAPVDVNGLTRDRTFKVRLAIPPKLQANPRSVTVRYRVHVDPSYQPGSPAPLPPAGSGTIPSTSPPVRGSRHGGT